MDIVETDYVKTFGFNPQGIGKRYRHHWIVTEPDEDDERAGATTGYLCVRARDGASNPIDAEACKHPNFIGTVEDDFDRTYRYYYYRPLTDADREDPAATITALRKRVEELEGALAHVRSRLRQIDIAAGRVKGLTNQIRALDVALSQPSPNRAAMDDGDGAEPLEIEESKAVNGQEYASDTPSRITADYTQSGMAATAPVTKDPTP